MADRWHLLHNLRQVLERYFSAAYARLKQNLGVEVASIPPDSSWRPQRRSPAEQASSEAARQQRQIPILVTFGEGLQRDYAAVSAALELPWSSGQAEGQINRLKTLKRQMYGRAGFELLRARVLRAA